MLPKFSIVSYAGGCLDPLDLHKQPSSLKLTCHF